MANRNDTRHLKVIVSAEMDDAVHGFHDVETASDKAGNKLTKLNAVTGVYAKSVEKAAEKTTKLSEAFKNAPLEKQIAQIARLDKKVRDMKTHVGIDVEVKEDKKR